MRAMGVILRAVARVMRRDLESFFALNNFFLFVLLLIYSNAVSGLPPRSAYPFLLLAGLVLLFPLSSDPLAKIPAVRLAMWPLTAPGRAGLRLASLVLSPVCWLAAILLARASLLLALIFLGLAAAIQIRPALVRISTWGRSTPWLAFPGKLGLLITAAVRQMFCMLDTYVAVAIAIGGYLYRWLYSSPDLAAYPVFSVLITLVLSTYTQSLFGLDSESARTRYYLLPLTSREILVSKDAAFLGLLFLMTAPLSPVAGLTSGLISLAIGHLWSLDRSKKQYRWRFTRGYLLPCAMQIILGTAFGLAAANSSRSVGFIALSIYTAGIYLRPVRGGTVD